MLKRASLAVLLALVSSVCGYANRVTGNSSYGSGSILTINLCTTSGSYECFVDGTGANAEEFPSESVTGFEVIDFAVTPASFDDFTFNLTITSGGSPIDPSLIHDYGAFVCDPSAPPQCGDTPPNPDTFASLSGNTISFDINGAPTTTSTPSEYVFYVALDDTVGSAAITASFGTSSVPEARFGGPLIAIVMLGLVTVFHFRRRALARS